MLSCDPAITTKPLAAGATTPSPALYRILQRFLKADTLNQHPKFYAVFFQQKIARNLTLYVMDVYNSTGDIVAFPLTTWQVDQKPFFVFTGLEAVATGSDTSYNHLIREVHAANQGKIWSPPLRCWRIEMKDYQIVHVEEGGFFFYPFAPVSAPPPPILFLRDSTTGQEPRE
ncbi:hypothetical protein [Hymenobacter wooponensis]|uniref:Uncharacterized protein n=1 Tax=Hymenobacter wooponensis TaxID=1525360 RepID=A0A4Z0MBQ1_9BACT|nr:hypothetical protein [Hymenobacter wooponensis]TGD76797.1 hypothetical protein EU557_25155 [Hymenobacter wooponensis]